MLPFFYSLTKQVDNDFDKEIFGWEARDFSYMGGIVGLVFGIIVTTAARKKAGESFVLLTDRSYINYNW